MHIEIKLQPSLCIFIDADSAKKGANYNIYGQNEHFQRNGQSFTTQKCGSQKDKI